MQCMLIGELTDIQRLLLAHGLQMLRTGIELSNLPSLETQPCRCASHSSMYCCVFASTTEAIMALSIKRGSSNFPSASLAIVAQ